jgi:hypothetical protein
MMPMTDRTAPPDGDPLLAKIRAIAAGVDRDAARRRLSDPAFVSLVDRAMRPYERFFTPEGLAEARRTAILGLITRPDLPALLERERERLAKQGSGVQPTRSATQLSKTARRARGKGDR